MLYSKKELNKYKHIPKIRKLKEFLKRNGFSFGNSKGDKKEQQYDKHKFTKENPNPNWE